MWDSELDCCKMLLFKVCIFSLFSFSGAGGRDNLLAGCQRAFGYNSRLALLGD